MSLWDSADLGRVWLVLPGFTICLCGRCGRDGKVVGVDKLSLVMPHGA